MISSPSARPGICPLRRVTMTSDWMAQGTAHYPNPETKGKLCAEFATGQK
jgi:hypothetical protein